MNAACAAGVPESPAGVGEWSVMADVSELCVPFALRGIEGAIDVSLTRDTPQRLARKPGTVTSACCAPAIPGGYSTLDAPMHKCVFFRHAALQRSVAGPWAGVEQESLAPRLLGLPVASGVFERLSVHESAPRSARTAVAH